MSAQPTLPIDPAGQRRLQLDEYHRMIDAGVFNEDDHLELLEGVLVAKSPPKPARARAIEHLTWALLSALADELRLRVRLPLTLPRFRSEPEPDLAVIDRREGLWSRHPERALLVVEVVDDSPRVADDSLRKDREAKARLYAAASVPEYWIINCRDGHVEVFRDTRDGEYASRSVARPGETLTCEAIEGVSLPVAAIFADD